MAAGTPEKLDLEPVGTGPASLARFRRNVTIRYRAFDGYWCRRQPIDTLAFSITPTSAARLTKLKAGECTSRPSPRRPTPRRSPRIRGCG
jgi:dipeptide transport system substrate-binding protein